MTVLTIYADYDSEFSEDTTGAGVYQFHNVTQTTMQAMYTTGKYGGTIITAPSMHFPLTGIPAGAIVTSASYNIYASNPGGTSGLLGIYRFTAAMPSTNANPTSVRLGTQIGTDVITFGSASGYKTFSNGVAAYLNGIRAATETDTGIAVHPTGTTSDSSVYRSVDYTGTTFDPYLSVTYNQAPTAPVVLTPNGGEAVDQTYNITWTAATDADGDALQYNIQVSTNNGGAWADVVALTSAGATSYTWNASGVAVSTQALIRIRAWDGYQYGPWDQSNAVFTVAHTLPVPTAVTPLASSTVSTDVPTLGATLGAGGSQKAEWQLATDTAFTLNLKTVTESDADVRTSGATTEVVPFASQLFQGTWYVRARAVPPTGGASAASAFSAYNSFTVSHAPTAANMTPTGDTKLAYGGAGAVTFDWDFSDPSPVDAQTAYRVEVTVVSTGVVVLDTGKVTSAASQATLNIPVTQKDVQLRWRVQVWDSDDVSAGYSGYNIFRVADAPTVVITSPANAGVMNQPQFPVTWTFTASAGRTEAQYRVRFTDQAGNVLVHDSGWIVGTALTYTPPTPILTLAHTYTVTVDVIDSWGIQGTASVSATATWTAPAAPTFTVV